MSAISPSAVYICADPGVPVFGDKGCSVHVQEMMSAFLEEGLDMHLIAQRFGGEACGILARAKLSLLPPSSARDIASRETLALAANRELESILDRSGAHDVDLIYERYSLWSYAGMEFSRRHGIPAFLEVNAPLIDEQIEHRGLVHVDECREVARRVFGAATHLLAVSDELASWLECQPGAHGKVSVLPNGVSPSRFASCAVPALAPVPGEFVIGFLGTLKPWHGLTTLVEAFAWVHRLLPGARLLLVGDGPERHRIESLAAGLGVASAVTFAGAVRPSEVPSWLAMMDVGVAPYPRVDSFYFSPLKVYEYLAAALPVVASRIGQISAVIQDGVTGLLVEPGRVEPLVEAILRLARAPEFRRSLGQTGRAWVLQHRTWASSVQQVRSLAAISETLQSHLT